MGAMAKRKRKRERRQVPTAEYSDAEGNKLTLRCELSVKTVEKITQTELAAATSSEDAWRRRTEMLFERLAVRWEISELPLTDQAMLIGRYRMADPETQSWVRETIGAHLRSYIPELAEVL